MSWLPYLVRNGLAAFALCAAASPILAQDSSGTSPPGADPIVVTGTRGEGAIVVDYRRIARVCAACRRALAALTDRAEPTRRMARQVRRDWESDMASVDAHVAGMPQPLAGFGRDCFAVCGAGADPRERLVAAIHRRGRPERLELARSQAGVAFSAGRYLAELERHLAPIVERHRVAHRARHVYRPGDISARYGRFPNVTAAVLDELNLALEGVDLLRPAAAQ